MVPSWEFAGRVSYRRFSGMWRSLVSAPALGAGGRGFESRHPDPFSNVLSISGSHCGSQRGVASRRSAWLGVWARWLPPVGRV